MSTHKYMDRICVAAVVLSLLLTMLFMNSEALGLQPASKVIGYEDRLFDTARVHTIEIVMDDWEGFIETCQNEEYSSCHVVIDGESYKNVGIRAKGNTSLSSVAAMGSSRYSFKIEFDKYDSTKSYHGLDKISLNNLIQDNTMMKDYLTYQMMNDFGVPSSLSSFVYITVNGEDWGLYLAVEGVEEAFLQRNYGNDYGELYKPDSMSFGGGRGNGRDFDINDLVDKSGETGVDASSQPGQRPDFGNFSPPAMPGGDRTGNPPAEQDTARQPSDPPPDEMDFGDFDPSSMFGGGFSFGGASDVKLQYIDDDPDSYSNIFSSAKTNVSDADQARLISSLKTLSSYENLEDVLDMDAVLRYFVVHNFVVNGDSYTGNMIHNYYLYEEDGRLAMIPWDYNLAFGTFMGGAASASVNDAIDDVLSDRPMQAWIFSDEAYTRQYHELYAEFLNTVDATQIINDAYALIADYVEKDPTKFCTYVEFETGVQTLRSFCALRQESVQGQLAGTIPSTSEGQNAQQGTLVNADDLNLSDMGTMDNGGGPGGFDGGMPGRPEDTNGADGANDTDAAGNQSPNDMPRDAPERFDGERPEGFDPSNLPDDFSRVTSAHSFDLTEWLWIAVSVLILGVGLIIAKFFKQ